MRSLLTTFKLTSFLSNCFLHKLPRKKSNGQIRSLREIVFYTLQNIWELTHHCFESFQLSKLVRCGIGGSYFPWLSTYHSQSSSKSFQMAPSFLQNDEFFSKMKSLFFSQYSFWMRKVVIWWLYSDDLRKRGQEPEKKRSHKFHAWANS